MRRPTSAVLAVDQPAAGSARTPKDCFLARRQTHSFGHHPPFVGVSYRDVQRAGQQGDLVANGPRLTGAHRPHTADLLRRLLGPAGSEHLTSNARQVACIHTLGYTSWIYK